ncbi:MAG: histidine--tRNA ligase [Clostridiales bacterium]|nr:histidine--tRNA ligase [Clostridiales bacterium]
MNKVAPRTLSGFMELPPEEQMLFDEIRRRLEDTYRSFGFYPIDTPLIEASEVLLAKGGGETEKQIYRFTKGDTDMSLRFDLTVPLAKYVAKNAGTLSFPFRRYQIGKVYRGERAQKGRFREFYQADIDIIGDGQLSIANDAEIPAIICQALMRLGVDGFTIRLNNRKVLTGLFSLLGMGDNATDVMRSVDKLEKAGRESVLREIAGFGVPQEKAEALLALLSFQGSNEETLEELRTFAGQNAILDEGVEELSAVLSLATALGVPKEKMRLDLTIARGLDYYTGTVYETTLAAHPEIGSVASGGRYDNLAGYYTDRLLPGVGMSIGLTRLFYILNERKALNDAGKAPADVLILPMTQDLTSAAALSARLRAAGLRVQIYLENKKFKHKIGYADKLGVPFTLFLGDDEIASNLLSLKDMATGEQEKLTEEAVAEKLLARRKALADTPCVSM